jgi:hypothetical protein
MNALEILYVFVAIHTSQIENQAVYLQTLESVHHCFGFEPFEFATDVIHHGKLDAQAAFNGRGCISIEGLIFLICLWSKIA